MKKNYMNKRFDEMKYRAPSILMSARMFIRIIILLVLLISSKFFCDWAVDQSHNHVDKTTLELYKKKKMKTLVNWRVEGIISKEEMSHMIDSINKNIKRDYIRERR